MLNVNNHVKLVGPRIVRSVLAHDKSFWKRNFTLDILWKRNGTTNISLSPEKFRLKTKFSEIIRVLNEIRRLGSNSKPPCGALEVRHERLNQQCWHYYADCIGIKQHKSLFCS